ncbi:MAG TPA: response regulator [Anaerolineaceae bacterium]
MPKVLIIDDEPIYHKMIAHAIKPLNFETVFALDGLEGLTTASRVIPDIVICDVNMPKMNGYEFTRQLRRDPRFAHTPVIILTAQADLEEKLEAFKAGADDHMTKPFAPAELLARMEILLRKSQILITSAPPVHQTISHMIGVQSLRGGVGCSSLAVNLAVAFAGIWKTPTMLLDLVMNAGQVALMLNASLRRTWTDICQVKPEELELEILHSIIGHHESGVDFIAAPTYPADAELLTLAHFEATLPLLQSEYRYIVADLPHDFGEIPLSFLDKAEYILLLLAPEMGAVRAAVAALDTYEKLGYPKDRIRLILNWTFERRGLARKNIESALHRSIEAELPFASELLVESINYGRPLVYYKPEETISELIENLAYRLSGEEHRKNPPAAPGPAWQRVTRRIKSN